MLRRAAPWLAAGILVVGGIAFLAPKLGGVSGLLLGSSRQFSFAGMAMTIPAEWSINSTGWPSRGGGSTWAIVGTLPWGACLPSDINCHYEQRLSAGQIDVGFGTVGGIEDFCLIGATRSDLAGRGPDDPIASGRLMRVDGRPTIQTDYAVGRGDYYRSDEWRRWLIANPDSLGSAYTIDAKYQGPDVVRFRTQLDAMIASVRVTEQTRAGDPATDCGPPFPP